MDYATLRNRIIVWDWILDQQTNYSTTTSINASRVHPAAEEDGDNKEEVLC
jgi:hypothetical protein